MILETRDDSLDWKLWYAWYPVRLETGERVVFEKVERKQVGGYGEVTSYHRWPMKSPVKSIKGVTLS